MKDLQTTLPLALFLCPFYNGQPIRPAGPQPAGTLTRAGLDGAGGPGSLAGQAPGDGPGNS